MILQKNQVYADSTTALERLSAYLVGWTPGDGTGTCGYAVEYYFDSHGRYTGPDEHGIEPIFSNDYRP